LIVACFVAGGVAPQQPYDGSGCHGQSNLIAFYLAFLPRNTRHNSANPKPDQKPITYLTKYLHQYLADEDVSSHHPLRMYGGQTLVLYGCTYLLWWGWRFMVKKQNMKKTNILR
jgi:hypothetical protein